MAEPEKFDANKAVDNVKKDRNLLLVVGGALALLVGMFLPWLSASSSFLSISVNGFDANGFFPVILLAVAVAAALNVASQDKRTMNIVAIAAAGLAALIVLLDWPSTGDLGGTVSVGFGYYLSLVGSVVMTVGAVMKFRADDAAKASKK